MWGKKLALTQIRLVTAIVLLTLSRALSAARGKMEGEAVERDTGDSAHGAAGASIESCSGFERQTYVEYETIEDSSTSCAIIE